MNQSLHAEFQKKMADQIYERFWIQTAETYREYTWENGKHGRRSHAPLHRPVTRALRISLGHWAHGEPAPHGEPVV
jgi:hypothetical protein